MRAGSNEDPRSPGGLACGAGSCGIKELWCVRNWQQSTLPDHP